MNLQYQADIRGVDYEDFSNRPGSIQIDFIDLP